jgi:hypothetical protein
MSEELTAIRTVLAEPEGPGDAAWTVARAALLLEIEESSGTRVRARRPRRWIPAVGLGTAVLIAGMVLLVTQVFVRGGAVQASPAAAAVLRRAADAVLLSPPKALKPGEYWYTENEGTYLDDASSRHGVIAAFVSQVQREWVGRRCGTRDDRLVGVRPLVRPKSDWQRHALAGFQANPSFTSCGGTGADQPVSYSQMLRAPTSTSALASWVLRAEAAPGFTPKPQYRAQIMFTAIHDILIEPIVSARLQAGLYRVAATIPGVRMLGLRHDTLGRTGLAVGFVDHNGYEDELLFDPRSYALLDYDETTRHRSGPLPAGTVTQETAFLAAGLVHRIGQVIRDNQARR